MRLTRLGHDCSFGSGNVGAGAVDRSGRNSAALKADAHAEHVKPGGPPGTVHQSGAELAGCPHIGAGAHAARAGQRAPAVRRRAPPVEQFDDGRSGFAPDRLSAFWS
ncbi:hypothetical protein [Pseudonocardia acidicola]|uniref:Uncharacterized protein n=1 Tax=Pseudonocardia acidicola TaxID=2724939 RepID=A0ABX1S7D3_9PSEU|nr:hypothetical protein [Pseudonocardia acidicola]NMH96507.1 hypothetical protein [Pseudonocardia acidicola]